MTDYSVKFTDTNKTPLTVEQDSEKTTSTDLVLFGRSLLEYGEDLNENLVRLLENFACPEDASSLLEVVPDVNAANDTLTEPVEGQIWFNTTKRALYQYDGSKWNRLSSGSDYAANWGQIGDGEALPLPVSSSGYTFNYNECIWIVSPAGHTGRFDSMVCTTDVNAVTNVRYRLLGQSDFTSGIANYLIIGIAGNKNYGASSYGTVELPTPTVTPTQSVGASPTPTPTPTLSGGASPTPTATPTKSPPPSASGVVTATPTKTPTPTPTKTPTPTPSKIPSLVVQITDVERGGAFTDALSLCDIADYDVSRDYGNIGCSSSTFGMCGVGECAPSPGTYSGGEAGGGAVMGVTVSGGVAPYTVKFKNFTATSGASEFAASGDCLFIGGSAGFSVPHSGTVYSVVIGASGGSVNGLSIVASCGSGLYNLSGQFTVEVTDAAGTVKTSTFPYAVVRKNEPPCFNITSFQTGFMLSDSNGGTTTCNESGFFASGTPTNWLPKSTNYTDRMSFTSMVGSPRKVLMGGVYKWWPRPAARLSLEIDMPNVGTGSTTITVFAPNQWSDANGTYTASKNIVLGGKTYTVNLSMGVTYDHVDSHGGDCNNELFYRINPSFTISPTVESCSPLYVPPPGGGSGEPFPGCVTTESMIYGSGKASTVKVGDVMTVIDPHTLELGEGKVSRADVQVQPCVRLTSESGVVLECSTTAPIATADGSQMLAPDLLGQEVLVFDNGVVNTEKVVNVEHIGDKEIVYITCENNFFLAGATEDRYFLHHNVKDDGDLSTNPVLTP